MQATIISTSADNVPSSSKSSSANNPSPGISFNQVLNKEISQQNNQSNQNTQSPQNTQNTQSSQSTTNTQTASKPSAPDKPAQADQSAQANTAKSTKGADKAQQASNDQADDTSKTDKSDSADASNSAQLLAFVGNLGQLATDPKKVDTSATSDATSALTAQVGVADITDKNIATSEAAKALLAQANATSVASDKTVATTIAAATTIGGTTIAVTAPAASDIATKADTKELPTDTKTGAPDASKDARKTATLATADSSSAAGGDKGQKSAMPQAIDALENSASIKTAALEKLQDSAQGVSPTTQSFAQQLAVSTHQAANAATTDTLAPRVGTPAWDQAVGQKVVWMVAGGKQTAELTLNPPDLGPLKVVLSVNNDQANATFTSAHPDVRDALESAMPKLRQMMSDAGVQLSGFSVNTQSSQQGNTPQDGRNNSPHSSATQVSASDTSIQGLTTAKTQTISKIGMVDTFA